MSYSLRHSLAALLLASCSVLAAEQSITGSPLHVGGRTASAQAALTLPRFTESELVFRLDGKLDDEIWSQVPAYDRMTLIDPDVGGRGRYPTQTFIFHTERGLYLGAFNAQPVDSLTTRLGGRDMLSNGDFVQILIDTSGEGRYGYWFLIALGGSVSDGTLKPERNLDADWDGPWQSETSKADNGWTLEVFLPWSMLNMPDLASNNRRMAVMVIRNVASLQEQWAWPGLSWTQSQFISGFQPIILQSVAPRQEFSISPYVSYFNEFEHSREERKAGADIFWRPSTAFLLNAAVNPDFGQVEADDIIVNLTAYETFFPEKRLFFTENQEVFQGSIRQAPSLLHTRRLGSSVGARPGRPDLRSDSTYESNDLDKPVELLFAGKGVGQFGSWRWGALGVAESDTDIRSTRDGTSSDLEAAGRNLGVLRLQHESTEGGGRRALGWMGTLIDHPLRQAVTHRLDAHFSTPGATWAWDTELYLSEIEGTKGAGGVGRVRWSPNRRESHSFRVYHYDDQLDLNDAGYLRRNDLAGLAYRFRRSNYEIEGLRERRMEVWVNADFNGRGDHLGSSLYAESNWTFLSNHTLSLGLEYNPSYWDDRNSRGNGEFKLGSSGGLYGVWIGDQSKPLYAFADASAYTEPEGSWWFEFNTRATWRPVEWLAFSAGTLYSNRDAWVLWQGGRELETFESETWSPRIQFDTFFTSRQQLRMQLEWTGVKAFGATRVRIDGDGNLVPIGAATSNFAISRVIMQIRYRWQIAPLSDLFIVYNRGGTLPGASAGSSFRNLFSDAYDQPESQALIVKLRYRFGS